jgi:hypothetical integral membrane protein (TIGR02206 family)
MVGDFKLFGPIHLLILTSIPITAFLLAMPSRHSLARARWIRYALGSILTVNELSWYAYRLRTEGFRFPEGLPLELCDLTLWLTVVAVFTLRPLAFEMAYFAGLAGSGMALLTPDLWAPFFSYPTFYFFVAHGTIIVTILVLLWTRLAVLRPGSVWRVFLALQVYTVIIGIFDSVFHTNYMYLSRKPESASVLDYLGPWPFYLAGGEGVALILFWLLWLPVRRGSRRSTRIVSS